MEFYKILSEAVGAKNVMKDEPMSSHTTFRVGGPADYFVVPEDYESLKCGMRLCAEHGMPYFVTGNGSNLLVSDHGYRGVIFNICHTLEEISFVEDGDQVIVTAGAGMMLSKLARNVSDMGYTGFEYATGIPGTLGGAVTMNAGAYGGEISDNILWAEVMDPNGDIKTLDRDELKLSYRHSVVMDEQYIVLKAAFRLNKGDKTVISERISELAAARKEKQPLEYPSAGSTFKRPEGYFAGKLIQDCGLKGYRVGGAMVSDKHSGFVVNVDHATAEDIYKLMCRVEEVVYEAFKVKLEPEVRMLGEF